MHTDSVQFISPALIRAVRRAVALDLRDDTDSLVSLTIKAPRDPYATSWPVDAEVILRRIDGIAAITHLMAPASRRVPVSPREQALLRSLGVPVELRDLLAELPYTGEDLCIPLDAYQA
ncbi:hypothetical protein ABZ565_33030 [Streptomyces sp. NPDC016469]|uniref:hypothetical protein n=1 Tax=Streptomyces sp. NPDC016469 TaxID=3157191 RepID=UPI0033E9CE08